MSHIWSHRNEKTSIPIETKSIKNITTHSNEYDSQTHNKFYKKEIYSKEDLKKLKTLVENFKIDLADVPITIGNLPQLKLTVQPHNNCVLISNVNSQQIINSVVTQINEYVMNAIANHLSEKTSDQIEVTFDKNSAGILHSFYAEGI